MIPYKDIGDNLTINEFNGIISLLRDNVNFEENITINNSTVNGIYGKYIFDFQEATILDNGILITNETLASIGTIELSDPVFPNSNYSIDLKIYSSTDVGISTLDTSDYIVTEISIPLQNGIAVNIPFETLEMDNIISFDAKIRINHKDLVIRGSDRLQLESNLINVFDYCPVTLTATYLDSEGYGVGGKQIRFYEGETVIGFAETNSSGIATLEQTYTSFATHTLYATSEAITSNNITVNVTDENAMELTFYNNTFESYSSTPLAIDGYASINYESNHSNVYSSGKISYNYSSIDNHTIKILGDINSISNDAFRNTDYLTSVTIPEGVTLLNDSCFYLDTNLSSVTLPDSLTHIGSLVFGLCDLETVVLPENLISLGRYAFNYSNLQRIDIPMSVQQIGNYCFANCSLLSEIHLNWDSSEDIIQYSSNWINGSSSAYFIIPRGTTSLYLAKRYPANKIQEGE